MKILDLPAIIQLGKMWRRPNQQLNWKISSVPVIKQHLQKAGKCFTVRKNCIQNIMIMTAISQ